MTQYNKSSSDSQSNDQMLREDIDKLYTLAELQILCFDLSIPFGKLEGPLKNNKITSLVIYVKSHDRFNDLIKYLKKDRPAIHWDIYIFRNQLQEAFDKEDWEKVISVCDDMLFLKSDDKFARDSKVNAEKEIEINRLHQLLEVILAKEALAKDDWEEVVKYCDAILALRAGDTFAKDDKVNAEKELEINRLHQLLKVILAKETLAKEDWEEVVQHCNDILGLRADDKIAKDAKVNAEKELEINRLHQLLEAILAKETLAKEDWEEVVSVCDAILVLKPDDKYAINVKVIAKDKLIKANTIISLSIVVVGIAVFLIINALFALLSNSFPFTNSAKATALAEASRLTAIAQAVSESQTPTPQPPQLIASNPQYRLRLNGEAQHIYTLEMDQLGAGTTELTYPSELNLNESAFVKLVIIPSEELQTLKKISDLSTGSSTDTIPADAPAPFADSIIGAESTLNYETENGDEIKIYPMMYAELTGGSGIDIQAQSTLIKYFDLPNPINWTWIITPREQSPQNLVLTLSVPVLVNDELDILQSNQLDAFLFEIIVQVTPTPIPPTPTSTPIPPSPIMEDPVNLLDIILTFILGVASVVILYLTYKQTQKSATTDTTITIPSEETTKPAQSPESATLDTSQQIHLHQILDNNYSEEELRTLCFTLGVDYDDLPATGQANKARELVKLMDRNGRLEELAAQMQKDRPQLFPSENEEEE